MTAAPLSKAEAKMRSDGYRKVSPPPPYISPADAPHKIELDAAPVARETAIDMQPQSHTSLSDFCNLNAIWPPDKNDSDFEDTPSYKRFSVYDLAHAILFFAPLVAVCGYLNVLGTDQCSHPRLNNVVIATLTVYAGEFTKMAMERYCDREWQGRREAYFRIVG